MKNILLLSIIFLFSATTSFSQKLSEKDVPSAVKESFHTMFPDAEKIRWGKEDDTTYEADFKMGSVKMSANFSEDGNWLETETEVDITSLPQAVSDAINRDYQNGKILSAFKIERADKSLIYEADIKVKSKKKEILYDEQGNAVK
jgi:uncharacterized membrane protein YkoI